MHYIARDVLTEDDFRANETLRLRELSSRIKACGKTALEISRACRMDKRTVQRAIKCLPVKSDAQARIELYIRTTYSTGV